MIEAAATYHGMYVKLFEAHKTAPNIWTLQECTRIMTAIMAAKSFSWRVVGITPLALELFADNNYGKFKNSGITRAHLVPRIKTVEALLSENAPYPQDEFLSRWILNDKTVICAKGENRIIVPRYISFQNDDGQLFSCANVLAGWRHTEKEREFLKNLHHRYQNDEIQI
jgi:hypothetical protein